MRKLIYAITLGAVAVGGAMTARAIFDQASGPAAAKTDNRPTVTDDQADQTEALARLEASAAALDGFRWAPEADPAERPQPPAADSVFSIEDGTTYDIAMAEDVSAEGSEQDADDGDDRDRENQPGRSALPAAEQALDLLRSITDSQMRAAGRDGQEAENYNIATMRLEGVIHNGPPQMDLFGGSGAQMNLRDWLGRLAKARTDENVHAVALEIDGAMMSWAQAAELADAVSRLSKVKPVYTYLAAGGATDYLVASAAGHVTLEPGGWLQIVGLGAELTFLAETMEWIGIEPQMVQVGDYKGAAEPLTRTEPSPQLKGEYNKLLDGLYAQMIAELAHYRNLTGPQVRAAIDQGPFLADEARDLKLVDALTTRLAWYEKIAQMPRDSEQPVAWKEDYGKKKAQSLDLSNPFALLAAIASGGGGRGARENTVAIIYADGMIRMGASGQSLFGQSHVGHQTLVSAFEKVRRDDNVKAVVFRIDSPGGSALASELIYQAVKRCNETKPVIASVGSMAASGGYYIAMGAREIVADPSGIVGSIGVISGKLATSELMGKLKMRTWEITRGANAGMAFSRPWDARELARIRRHATKIYRMFVDRVQTGRGERIDDVEQVAAGRIFTAAQGRKLGMVDELGGLAVAVQTARGAAGLEQSHILELPRPRSLMDLLGGGAGAAMESAAPANALLRNLLRRRPGARYWLGVMDLLEGEQALTVMPYHLDLRR